MIDLSTGSPWETITLTTLSRDRKIFNELLYEAQNFAMKMREGKTVIYMSWGPEWRPFGQPRRRRMLESVILDKGVKEQIIDDIKDFLNNENWYSQRGTLIEEVICFMDLRAMVKHHLYNLLQENLNTIYVY